MSDENSKGVISAPVPSQILTRQDGATIAYRKTTGKSPGVLFLAGFRSDMTGTKATMLESMCREQGRGFVRFDYFGHGESSGDFTEGTIDRWAEDAIAVLDEVCEGPQVLVGSSMGGWIMLLVALAHPQRIDALVGIAAAPDFTETLMWDRFGADIRQTQERDGIYHEPSEYDEVPTPITMKLIREARAHLLLDRSIAIHCPVRLIHGMRDEAVPWGHSLLIRDVLLAHRVTLTLIKDGDHRLSRDNDLRLIGRIVNAVCEEMG